MGVSEVLYFRHGSSREHDPRVFLPEHPDTPERIDAIESALERAGWAGCLRVQAPARKATVGSDVRAETSRDPRDKAKAGLLEAQSPDDEGERPPERHPMPARSRPATL